jgi:hypothetical protein
MVKGNGLETGDRTMAEPVSASLQYDDFKGTVCIDEAESRNLLQVLKGKADVPKGYWPVGFGIFGSTDAYGKHGFQLTVYAVDAEVALTGDELRKYAHEHDGVPVFRFNVHIEPEELAGLLLPAIKRLQLVVATKAIEGKPMLLLEDN